MAGVPGMHKKKTSISETMPPPAPKVLKMEESGSLGRTLSESAQEEKFLTEVVERYSFWNKQPGDKAKLYATAYKALLNEFTAEESK